MRIVIMTLCFLMTAALARADQLSQAAGQYVIDRSSRLHFSVAQIGGGGMSGNFTDFSGNFMLDGRDIGRSRVDFVLKAEGIEVADARIAEFIRSDAVFNAGEHPKITFRSTSVKRTGENTAHVEGNLTARGITRTVGLDVEFAGRKGSTISFHATGKISRALFGMEVGTPIYSNMVVLDLDIVGKRI